MTTIKSFTDLQQSKKLAEILPLESVDAFYIIGKEPVDIVVIHGFVTHKHLKEQIAYKRAIPCWSLASLLNVLPFPSLHKTFIGYRCDSYNEEGTTCKLGESADNPIDACYEMILKLNELKLL